jgi:hypothetical protein
VNAATYFRLAVNQGATKQAVATAREAARTARAAAQPELPQALTLAAARNADSIEADAIEAERKGDLAKARDLWTKVAGLWGDAAAKGRPAREALSERGKAEARKVEADAEMGTEYDADDMEKARAAMDDGDAALAREEFAKAQERYGQAEYRWKQAAIKSAPQSRPRRKIDVLRREAQDARGRAIAAGRRDTKRFDEAERCMTVADEYEKRKPPYWRGAEEYYNRAKAIFDDLAGG